MPIDGVVLVTSNHQKLERIFKLHKDSDYKAVKDERYEGMYPVAEVVTGVNIGEGGEILPKNPSSDKPVVVAVELSYIPGQHDPLEVLPCNEEFLGRKHNKEEKGIFALDDKVVDRYKALFEAAKLFNTSEVNVQKIAS